MDSKHAWRIQGSSIILFGILTSAACLLLFAVDLVLKLFTSIYFIQDSSLLFVLAMFAMPYIIIGALLRRQDEEIRRLRSLLPGTGQDEPAAEDPAAS